MKIKTGQSLFDIAIQHCGSAEAAFDLAVLNGVSLTDDISAGIELELPPVVNKNTVNYYANKSISPCTGITGVTWSVFDYTFDYAF
jgi:hypothetical protein